MRKVGAIIILKLLLLNDVFADNNEYVLDSCLMNLKFKKFFYSRESFLDNNQSWGFEVFYEDFLLGPSVNCFKATKHSKNYFEGSLYPQEQSLNRMYIGLAQRNKFGHISIGLIEEITITNLYVLENFNFPNEKKRLGLFFGSELLFQRNKNFMSKIKIDVLIQALRDENEYAKQFGWNFIVSSNLYEVNLKKIGISPLISAGTHGMFFEQNYFYEVGLAFSLNKSPYKKMRNNLLTFSYQKNSRSYNFKEEQGFFILSLNVDLYYLGIFKDLRGQ